jgi:hypothetical protein
MATPVFLLTNAGSFPQLFLHALEFLAVDLTGRIAVIENRQGRWSLCFFLRKIS